MSAVPAPAVRFVDVLRAMEASGAQFTALADFAHALSAEPSKNSAHALVHAGRGYPRRALAPADEEAKLGVRAIYAFTTRALSSAVEGSDDFAAIARLRALGHEVMLEAAPDEVATADGWREIERVGEVVIAAGSALHGILVRAGDDAATSPYEPVPEAVEIVDRLRERHRLVGLVCPPELLTETPLRPRFLVTEDGGRYVADCLRPEFPILTPTDEYDDDVVLRSLVDTVARDSCLWIVR